MLQQIEDQQQHGRVFKIKSNEPLLLDAPVVWLLQSGAITLFTVVVNNGIPEGARSYLSSVEADSALFGTALSPQPGKQLGLLAVAMEETYLLKVSLEQLGESIVRGDTEAIAQLENWIHRLGAAIRTSPPAVSLPAADNRAYLSLTCGQTFQATPGTVTWVKIQQGRAKWLGLTAFTLDPTSEVFPLGTGMWLEAADDIVELAMTTTADADWDLLSAGLAQLHTSCRSYFQFEQQQEAQAAFSRFQERARLNRQVTQTALDELASVLQPQEAAATLLPEGTPLLVAAGAVGRVLGVPIQPPRRSEEIDRVKDPLEAIARASQIRTRRVLLAGNWWQQNNGPLLAYLQQERPVALLPVSVGRYELFDPVERTRTQVDARVAAGVSPEAYMFYRPLTDKVKHASDLFLFSIRGYERDLLLMIVAGVAVTLLGMVTPQATAILIDSAIPDSDRGLLWQIGLALFAVAFGQAAFELARGVVSLRVENAADSALQPAVWDRLLSLKPAFFRQYSSGDIQSRVLSVGQIRRQLSGTTLRTIFSGVFAVLNLGLMFTYSASLTVVATVLAVVAMFATIVTSLLALRKVRPLQQIDGLLLGLTVQLINGVSKLRVAAAEERAFAHWGKTYSREKRLKAASQRIDDSLAVFNETLPTISSVLLFWFAIVFMQQSPVGSQGGLTAGTFLAFNAAFGIFIQGATSLSNTLANVLNIVPLWERAQSIVKAVPEATADQADPGRLTGRLRLEHVTFRYREDGPLTLDDVSIHAEPGEFVAVVGPSGSGKSTVFRLLLGFETPASGTVYYDGQDLSGLDIRAVRRQLGVVMQAGKLSTGSVFELITGGALVTMDEAWEAAHNAGFADDVKQMPMQMHTVVSEGGSNLSGGQRQRLLIARALVMKPKIILMDEATSALDNNTQAIVTASLDRMNATRIVIAHRLSTIRNADRIYVVEAGRVVQAGNFDQLVGQEGLFARLVARQIE